MPITGECLNDPLSWSRHALARRWQAKASFAILLSDFAQGEVFFTISQAWQRDPARSQRLHWIAFVQPPFSAPQLRAADSTKESHHLVAELQQKWPLPMCGFHRIFLNNGEVMLTLLFGDSHQQLPEVSGPIDAFILNQTDTNLELSALKQIWRLCRADSTIISFASDQSSQDQLNKTGFHAQVHTTNQASFLTASCVRAPKSNYSNTKAQEAVVIGAGIAGCAVAASLAQRGWKIRLIDAQASIASQASGNHVGLCHPTFSLDDNFQARLSRAGFLLTQQRLNDLRNAKQAVHFAADGHFQIAKDHAAAALMQTILSEQKLPVALVSWLSAEQAQQQLNLTTTWGGWWFPQGMWINPASACKGYIDINHSNIDLELNTYVKYIQYKASEWHLFNANDHLIASTATLILANAHDAARLLPDAELALSSSLRSVTRIPAAQINTCAMGFSGLTYLTAAFAGWRCAGASLVDTSFSDPEIEASNLKDLADLLGEQAILSSSGAQTRQCARPNSADRLPLVGQIPDTRPISHSVHQLCHIPRIPGLFGVLGFGARGLSWHALAAEVLACQLSKEPHCIERSLVNAMDPARFALRRLRKSSALPRA